MKRALSILLILSVTGCVSLHPGGPSGGTALVCHKGKKTMELPREAVQGHLNHGDRLGPC